MSDRSPDQALEQWLNARTMDRRRFIGRAGSSALALSGLSAVLAACGGVEGEGGDDEPQAEATPAVQHPEEEIGRLVFSNWPLYIDRQVLRDFDDEFGANTRYIEDINDNYEFFGRVRQQLANDEDIGRDLVVLTDYMAARWVRSGWVEPIDRNNVPNIENMVAEQRSINYDPQRSYTMPWASGAVGLGYNRREVGRELRSLSELFNPEFRGQVSFLQEPYDSAGLVMLKNGLNPSEATLDQILEAIEELREANEGGQIRRFTVNDYVTDLARGNTLIAVSYSGDLVQLSEDNPDLEFVYAEEGSMFFTDNMLMPANVAHPYTAEVFMNYVYEPEVAAKIAEYVNYISPVEGIRELAPEIADNELIFPPDEVRQNLHPYPNLGPDEEREMQAAMAEVTGA
jgi:spermidine/putrescine transport system substrate-binding protein